MSYYSSSTVVLNMEMNDENDKDNPKPLDVVISLVWIAAFDSVSLLIQYL